MKYSISDIAEKAGVSTGTVSRVLNGKTDVRAETRRSILAIVAEFNSRPQRAAAGGTIGIALKNPENIFTSIYFSRLMNGISGACFREGMDLKIFSYQEADPENFIDLVNKKNPSGIIMLQTGPDDPAVLNLAETAVPHAVISNRFKNKKVSWIDSDHRSGMLSAVNHLIGLGHKNIICITPLPEKPGTTIRIAAFRECMQEYNPVFSDDDIIGTETSSMDEGFFLFHKLQKKDYNRPTAAIITNSNLAFGFLKAAKISGLKIPADFSIISFDDTPYFESGDITVTCVQQQLEEMGSAAALHVIAGLAEKKTPLHMILPVKLAVRQSACGSAIKKVLVSA
ncbi:MAG: hypothetical protein A2096_16505 [Spirochaetes bacterium GWF1_41_5]|nr:MAG: hypothetical protein A2096_16505 [Spirochaetes bacterium GWF1_41_5]